MLSRAARLLAVAGALGWATSAHAVPVTYYFQAGSATITAEVLGNTVAGPVNVALTGISVTVDEGLLTVNSAVFTTGSSGNVTISPTYAGYHTINIDFASLSALNGSLSLVDPGPPAEYGYSLTNVSVTGQMDVFNTNPFLDLVDAPFGFVNPTASGTLFIDPVDGKLFLDGITLGEIGDPNAPLSIKGDFVFEGIVPEPGTMLLLVAGLAGLGLAGRRRAA